ncbi:unnamed protein product [Prunus armeniaca]|uniref:Uncharacterized protein n=1 Tax=Prunus armeniaca TaxID=36596 RepID=A0A6J5WMT7_PRUAR|nr:unnamed protein product [Prunus armeniaca]
MRLLSLSSLLAWNTMLFSNGCSSACWGTSHPFPNSLQGDAMDRDEETVCIQCRASFLEF